MPRVRQFSAQRNELSKSRLYESRNIAPSSNISNSRVQKYQIATPTSNKRQQNHKPSTGSSKLSDSRVSQKSSSSEYICTGCFNHKLASDKKEERRNQLLREKQHLKYQTEFSLREDHEHDVKHSKQIKEFNEVKEYNRKLMSEKQKSKFKQLQRKNQLIEQQRRQNEGFQNREKLLKQQKIKANEQLLRDIQHQIQYKQLKQKKAHDESTQLNQAELLIGATQEIYFKEKTRKQNQYRNEILQQIKQKQIQRKSQQEQVKDFQNSGVGIVEAAYQREVQRQKIISERQQLLLQEANKIKQAKQRQLEQERRTQQKQEKQRIKFEEQKIILEKQFSSDKKLQVQQYLHDISQQIEAQHKRKEKQTQEINAMTKTSIEIIEKPIDRKSCNSCEKKFSKTFLTKLK